MKWNPFERKQENKKPKEENKLEQLHKIQANQLLQEQREKKELSILLEKYCSTWQSGFYTKANGVEWAFSPTTLNNKYPYSRENMEDDKNVEKIQSSVLGMTKIATAFYSLKSWAVEKIDLGEGKILTILNEKVLNVDRGNDGRSFHQEELIWKYGEAINNTASLLKNISTPTFPITKGFEFTEFNPETDSKIEKLNGKEIVLYLKIHDALVKGEKIWVCYDDERFKFEPLVTKEPISSSGEDFKDKVRNFKISDLKYYNYAENLLNALPASMNISVGFEIDQMSINYPEDVKQNLIFAGKERAIDQRSQGQEHPVRPIDGYTPLYTSKLSEPSEEDIERFNAICKI